MDAPIDALLPAFARHLGLPAESARPVLGVLLDALRSGLDTEGTAALPGVGRFEQGPAGIAFEPAPALLVAVNAPFAGLRPVVDRSSGATPLAPRIETPAVPFEPPAEPTGAQPFFPAPTLAEVAPEDAGAADALDDLLAGVWAPADASVPEHPLGPSSEPLIEDAEYDVVGTLPEPEAPETAPVPERPGDAFASEATGETTEVVEAGGAEPVASPAPAESTTPVASPVAAPLALNEPPVVAPPFAVTSPGVLAAREDGARGGTRALVFGLPLLALLAALAAFLLLPRPGDDRPNDTAAARLEAAPVAANPLADSLLAPTSGTAVVPAPSDRLPAPLRGPGGVEPSRGGATWVLGVGSRAGAEGDAAHYRGQGYRTAVLAGQNRDRTSYQVVVGQFASFEEALRYRDALPPGTPSGAWVLVFE